MNASHYYTFRFEEEFDSEDIKPYIETHWKVVVFTSLGKGTHNTKDTLEQDTIELCQGILKLESSVNQLPGVIILVVCR